jgi:hypothetical protein
VRRLKDEANLLVWADSAGVPALMLPDPGGGDRSARRADTAGRMVDIEDSIPPLEDPSPAPVLPALSFSGDRRKGR